MFVSGDKDFSAPQKVSAQSGVSDAIGVRVVSNPKHYSPLTWYYHQGFQGSPKRTRVDGYKAIQEGRSTYVTVGNVEGDTLNTYVYIISYDQGAERMTREIYGQIIDNWEFNQNIDNAGTCTISNLICSDSEDCPAGYICLQDKCQISGEKPSCHIDEDCPSGIYCDSQKAKIIRDVERMGEITDVQSALESYRARNGGYPILSSGTYLKYKTTSAWPSWQKELGAKLGTKMPLDPVNTFGVCSTTATFTPETCWDKANSRFARTIDGNGQPQLREGDNIYFYNTLSPQDYILCANLETDAEFSNLGSYGCQSSPSPLTNNPPTVQNPNLNGSAGGSFTGYLQITDPEGDNIILNTAIVPSTTISSGWSTNNGEDIYISQVSDNEFLVEADSAPTASGDYTFDMEIEDSYQNQTTQTITISIGSNPPQIDVSGCANNVDVTHSYTCTTTCLTSNCDQFQYSWDLGKPGSMTNNTDTGVISGTPQVSEAGDYEIIIRAKDVTSGLLSQAETLNLSIQNFCGDGVVQDPNMKGVNEECESAGNGTSLDDQWECDSNCQWTGGYCGDGTTDSPYEDCDGSGGTGTSSDNQWGCDSSCNWDGGWCGDGICGSEDSTYTADDSEVCGFCGPDCGENYDNEDGTGDGIGACKDNCPDTNNPSQTDVDGDGIGDMCDPCYEYNGGCVELTITQGAWSATMTPYGTEESISEFYCYEGNCTNPVSNIGASSNIAEYDMLKDQRSEVFAHIDNSSGVHPMMSLGFIHDIPQTTNTSEPDGRVDFYIHGEDWAVANIEVRDDGPTEFYKETSDPGNNGIYGKWGWLRCCTDGGAMSMGRLYIGWEITIDPNFYSTHPEDDEIIEWFLKSPGHVEVGTTLPSTSTPITISYEPPNP